MERPSAHTDALPRLPQQQQPQVFLKGAVVTETTPGHDGPGVPRGDAFQDGCLVDVDGEVLRTG